MHDQPTIDPVAATRRILELAHDLRTHANDVAHHAAAVEAGARTGEPITAVSIGVLRGMTVMVGLAVDAIDPTLASRPRLVYVAGPYRAPTPWGVTQNIQRAQAVAARVWQAGLAAVCPHINSAHMEGVATDEQFLAGTMEMLRRCDAVVLVDGWRNSAGTQAEVKEANRLGIRVFGVGVAGCVTSDPAVPIYDRIRLNGVEVVDALRAWIADGCPRREAMTMNQAAAAWADNEAAEAVDAATPSP